MIRSNDVKQHSVDFWNKFIFWENISKAPVEKTHYHNFGSLCSYNNLLRKIYSIRFKVHIGIPHRLNYSFQHETTKWMAAWNNHRIFKECTTIILIDRHEKKQKRKKKSNQLLTSILNKPGINEWNYKQPAVEPRKESNQVEQAIWDVQKQIK